MSAIGGVYSRVGVPVDRGTLIRVSRGLATMGPDEESFACLGPIGMLYRSFHVDSQSRRTSQPLLTAEGYMLVFDGRIDNGPDLRQKLSARGLLSDVELCLAAYLRWGVQGFGELIGDFALALWDASESRLVLACDALGRRPLYYRLTPTEVAWASMCRPLVDVADLHAQFDDEFIASFLVNRPSTHSPFRGVQVLPGGHVLTADSKSTEMKRYWSLDPLREISYRTDGDYEQHFRELLEEAVACRLRADGPVFMLLSGGIDSSSIACMAERLSQTRAHEAFNFQTASIVFDHSASSDERTYITLVEKQIGRPGIHISEEKGPILKPIPESFVADIPSRWLCFLGWTDYLTMQMRRAGARVLLAGHGGDQLFWSQPLPGLEVSDLLARGQLIRAFARAGAWSKALKLPLLQTIWRGGCWGLLPRALQAVLALPEKPAAWLDAGFVKRLELRERALPMADDVGYRLPSRAIQYGMVRLTMRLFTLEWCSSEGYVDARYPYLDRRIVEFALAIPFEQSVRLGEGRSLVRRALKGVLPEPIRRRRTKGDPGEAFHRALIREWPRISGLLDDPRLAAYGFVDRDAFRNALGQARHGLIENHVQLQAALSLELWIRAIERSTAPSASETQPRWTGTRTPPAIDQGVGVQSTFAAKDLAP